MSQQVSQKVVNTFVKGLITEAGPMTFPEDASVDELNCLLNRDGSRRRRDGLVYETANVLSTFTTDTDELIHTGTWFNVGGDAEREWAVVQHGPTLSFYNKSDAPFSSHETAHTVDLRTYEYTGTMGVGAFKCQFTSINGKLVVANAGMNTIVILENEAGTLEVEEIEFRVRDFVYLSNREHLSNPVHTDSIHHNDLRLYDNKNSGWSGLKGDEALEDYMSSRADRYPPLNLPWFAGKDASGDFSVTEWERIQGGSSIIGNGHYILDFFVKDRSTASGISGLPSTNEDSRFSCVAAFQNRVFYSGLSSNENGDVVLFSQLLQPQLPGSATDTTLLGEALQRNDPTSEDFPDLLDTDGGEIRIPEAYGIKILHPFSNGLFVFASNGVWFIKGVDDVFSPTGYSVVKVSSVGIVSETSFVSADGLPFWWSPYGIHSIEFDPQTFQPTERNLSISTIQTFFDEIATEQKHKVTGAFDRNNKRILWMYPNDGETYETKFNNLLWLDLPLGAFYPWKIEDQSTSTNSVVGVSYYNGFGVGSSEVQVVDSSETDVVDASGELVVVSREDVVVTGDPLLVMFVRDGATGKLTIALFTGQSFLDWGTENYLSFCETGYDFMGDVLVEKNAPYIQVLMQQTETGWTGNETTGYDPVRPSSLLVSTFWDFRTSGTTQQEAYRLKPLPVVDPSSLNSFNYPKSVVQSRLKIRGKGHSMRIRFESSEGKDFHLIGYGILHARNQRY